MKLYGIKGLGRSGAVVGLLGMLLLINRLVSAQSAKFGDRIDIEYTSSGNSNYTGGYVNYGWHKIVENHKTVKTVGLEIENLFYMQSFKKYGNQNLDERSGKSNIVYTFSDGSHLQYIIKDGDTINYYDSNGRRQGWFVHYFFNGYVEYDNLKKKTIDLCPSCYYFFNNSFYQNDTLLQDIWFGYPKDDPSKIDTIELNYFLDDTAYIMRKKINPDFYTVKKIKNSKGVYNSMKYDVLHDTVIHYYNSGEVYSVGTAVEHMQWYGDNYVFWKNGNLKYKWNFINGVKEGLGIEHRENGTLKRELYYQGGHLIRKKCFDESGKKEVLCE